MLKWYDVVHEAPRHTHTVQPSPHSHLRTSHLMPLPCHLPCHAMLKYIYQVFDYDQLLDKRPGAADALFGWHQDMAYWPTTDLTPDTRTGMLTADPIKGLYC